MKKIAERARIKVIDIFSKRRNDRKESTEMIFVRMCKSDKRKTTCVYPRAVTKEFAHRAKVLGFPGLRFHDLRGTHETLLLDQGVPVHVVAARCGHDPAVMLRSYAKRTRKADTSAASVIGAISKRVPS